MPGRRKSAKAVDDPTTPNVNEAEKGHSAAQTSRINRIEIFDAMIATLGEYSVDKPNETDLQIASLEALSANLKTLVADVNAKFVLVSNELNTRTPPNTIKFAVWNSKYINVTRKRTFSAIALRKNR